jgi:L-lactate dehydrogenase complex protein LldG
VEPEAPVVSDRELILSRIRAAIADVPADDPPAWSPDEDADPAAAYRRTRALAGAALIELFIDRCREYAATVSVCADAPDAIAEAIAGVLARHHAITVAVPADLDPAWWSVDRFASTTFLPDEPPLSVQQLDGCDGVLTGCALAIAETGTLVLDAGVGQGRRALTLVPDLHICVVRSGQIFASVPESISALDPSLRAGTPVTFISGPSATSDIELNRVEGVHGPRRLEIVVAESTPSARSAAG